MTNFEKFISALVAGILIFFIIALLAQVGG